MLILSWMNQQFNKIGILGTFQENFTEYHKFLQDLKRLKQIISQR